MSASTEPGPSSKPAAGFGQIDAIERYFIAQSEYQRLHDEMDASASPENWERFRAWIVADWFDLYEQGLRELGYDDVDYLESYTWGAFTYSQNMTMHRDDEWWAQHRDSPRIVAVHGFSVEVEVPRDNPRLRYHGESLIREYGEHPNEFAWDKGHFMGHKLGGQIDNGIFAQRRDVNRGWGEHKGFFEMERYAQANPGVFVFCRPIYGDGSSCPFYIEYGILRPDNTWWVRIFPNRYSYTPFRGFDAFPEWKREQIRLERERWQARTK